MKPKALIRQQAEADIDDIAGYLAQHNLSVGLRFYEAVEEALERLAAMPRLGAVYGFEDPVWAEVRFWPIRQFRNYLIFYRPVPEGVEVLRVLHGARDLPRRIAGP